MKPVAPGHTALAQDRIQTLPIQTEPGSRPSRAPVWVSASSLSTTAHFGGCLRLGVCTDPFGGRLAA